MAVSDVIPQDGGQGNVKLHPYLATLVRWCVSCLWSTATVILHRLVTTPLPPIAASKPPPRPVPKSRQAGTEHLHPEPRVECVVLHTPDTPTLDVIFVHGLYGSLGNTWRQGEWRTKYKLDPTKVALRNHSTEPCSCTQNRAEHNIYNDLQQIYAYDTKLNETNLNDNVTFNQFNGCFQKILPNENALITEKFYNNTLMRVDVDNYETQAKFVTELFKNDCDKNCDLGTFKCNFDENGLKCNCEGEAKRHTEVCKCKLNEICKLNVNTSATKCAIGCGCICDECYSSCWPRDWIKEDFPGARVITINYTSDPYLWRPLWVKGNKRLRLHERAQQMMDQLLQLGVGQRPIIWVGHSKGGLFIKQIYCEAYEAYLKMDKNKRKHSSITNNNSEDQSNREYDKNNINNKYKYNRCKQVHTSTRKQNNGNCSDIPNNFMNEQRNSDDCTKHCDTTLRSIDEMNEIRNNNNSGNNNINLTPNNEASETIHETDVDNNYNIITDPNKIMTQILHPTKSDDGLNKKQARYEEYSDISVRRDEQIRSLEDHDMTEVRRVADLEVMSSNDEEDSSLPPRASLWSASSGFMFYSVPHRGSPLADIKTPITCRSVELQEIAKDCPLVLQLQERWLVASRESRPLVRSLVETCKTLMSVLWLRIVSEDSADAGVGSLHGVSVDHREICKPSSRSCLLYTELTELIRGALSKCNCQ